MVRQSRRMIDIIRDGVRAADLRAHGDRAVWEALGVTALAALNAGWSRPQWEFEVLHPRSILGLQARVDRRDRVRSGARRLPYAQQRMGPSSGPC